MAHWTVSTPQRLTLEEPVTRLAVHLISGRLNIVGTDGPARVEITGIRRNVTINHEDGVLAIKHDRVHKWPRAVWWLAHLGWRLRVDISIAVPRDAAVDVRLIDGPVVASGLRAGLDVRVTSGRITLLGIDGQVRAKLVSGPVEAVGVGGELTMETISGELTLADSTASRVNGVTVSGSITCDLDNPSGGNIQLQTTSGEITVRVREDSDLAVHLHTMSGRITSAFPQLSGGRRDAFGVLGDGKGKLVVSTVSGGVALLASPVDDSVDDSVGDSVDDEVTP